MNAEIPLLCEKFGVTAEYLISEYSRYLLVKSLIEFFISVIVLALSIRVLYKYGKNISEDSLFTYFIIAVLVVVSIVCAVAIPISFDRIVGLLASPTATVIDYILTSIN